MSAVIKVESLGKKYRRGMRVDTGLRHALERFVRSPFSVFRGNGVETFWALKDVSLEVKHGEVLGLIGRNGAGKTTLLKILSRITRPTEGWAEIRGHVGSLLEVGTGFHPELTGRENTFLSGAILGMSKREIARKFDEIVAFAELEKFIDTPVKHYSSGMYVRLAFAVAAHLEPEILLVDEVLAVGDINFQKKCLGKMGEVAQGGRTVVLVSHQLNQIRRLCQRVIWIDGGSIRQSGPTHEVVSAYESAMAQRDNTDTSAIKKRLDGTRFLSWELEGAAAHDRHTLNTFGAVSVKFGIRVTRSIELGHHGVALFNHDGQLIWGTAHDGLRIEPGEYEFCHSFPSLPLRPGAYSWRVSLYDGGELVDSLDCVPQMLIATQPLGHPHDEWSGFLNVPNDFRMMRQTVKILD
jgi:lipopolysaccharide transport system ATP-binding protein